MAIGLTPRHTETIVLTDLTEQQFLIIAIETAQQLNWEFSYISHSGFIAYTNNDPLMWLAEVRVKIKNGLVYITSSSMGTELVDWGKNKKIILEFMAAFDEGKSTFNSDETATKYEAMQASFVPPEQDILSLPASSDVSALQELLYLFKPTKDFFFTPIIIDINILIFILMAFGGANIMLPDNESLLNWGANFKPLTLEGQWWRILTACFLHIGIIHLLLNVYALLYIGALLEPILGKAKFIIAYLLTGIAASIASLWWHDITISAGASGAIFGMYGIFLALLSTNLIEAGKRKALLASIVFFVGYNLLNGLKDGIDNAAHIGGLVSGLLIGFAFLPSLKRPDNTRLSYTTIGLVSIVILISSFSVYKTIPNDFGKYDTQMAAFGVMEEKALSVFHLPPNTPNDSVLFAIKDNGIDNWKKMITLLDGFKDLDLPLKVRTRNRLLKEYCELRLKSYELYYRAHAENTGAYKYQIAEFDTQIENKIKELNGEAPKK
ncbi:MAG: rhomboid family intramembrane serine protease [Bacteroidota bacterium]